MKKYFVLILIFMFFITFSVSCQTKNKDINNGRTQTVPQTSKSDNVQPQNPVPTAPQEYTTTPQPPAQAPASPAPAAPVPTPPKQASRVSPKPSALASYQTPLQNKDKERVDNIMLAAKILNNHEVKPNETFSFNETVGKRDAEHGFKTATIIVNGDYDEGMGGGVCQLSSTLFNAASKSGLEIVERHAHSKPVTYVGEGKDAAVSYGYYDFKFKNNKTFTVKIKASITNNKVSVSIWKA